MNKGKFTDLLLDAWIFFSRVFVYLYPGGIDLCAESGKDPGDAYQSWPGILELFLYCWASLLSAGFFLPCTGIIGKRTIKRSQRGHAGGRRAERPGECG